MGVPDMPTLENKNVLELRNLTVTQIKWSKPDALSLTLSDDQSCEARSRFGGFTDSHTFDRAKNITQVKVIIHKDEKWIIKIKFFSGEEKLVAVGYTDDAYVAKISGRVETFEIAVDEQLIGCELDHGTDVRGQNDFLRGVTWLKWKINS